MKVVTLGEIMIRLQPYDHLRFVQTDTLQYTYGGGEANVAVSLANYGADVAFVTKLPAHAIGQAGVNALLGRDALVANQLVHQQAIAAGAHGPQGVPGPDGGGAGADAVSVPGGGAGGAFAAGAGDAGDGPGRGRGLAADVKAAGRRGFSLLFRR